jgi:hypothetical protein
MDLINAFKTEVYIYKDNVTHNLLNVLVQIANKMGFKKNGIVSSSYGSNCKSSASCV